MWKEINYWLQVAIRSILGAAVLPYGVSKLLTLQFQVPAFQYTRPLGEVPGTYLTWAFLGYASWLQILLGFAETIPAFLLFFRRTQRLGAVLLFPVLLNVVLVNFALGLWPATRIISLALLMLCTYLLIVDLPQFRAILALLIQQPSTSRGPLAARIERMISAVFVGSAILLAVVFAFVLLSETRTRKDFVGDRQINRAGDWVVEEFIIAGENVLPPAPVHIYFDFAQDCYYLVRGSIEQHCAFNADSARHIFSIEALDVGKSSAPISGTYRVDGERLKLTGTRDGQSVNLLLRRANWGKPS